VAHSTFATKSRQTSWARESGERRLRTTGLHELPGDH